MAHTKSAGATKGSRKSVAKRLGVKLFGGQKVISGNIIVRQKGTKFHTGLGVKLGRDFTIYAVKAGIVHFFKRFDKTFVAVK